MNTNVIELLLVLAAGIGGTAALHAGLRRRGRRSSRLGIQLMQPRP
jgi:hypothetical protein